MRPAAAQLPPGAGEEAVFVLSFIEFLSFLIYFSSPGTSTPYESYAPHVYSVIYSTVRRGKGPGLGPCLPRLGPGPKMYETEMEYIKTK